MTSGTAVLIIVADPSLAAVVRDRIKCMGHATIEAPDLDTASDLLLKYQFAYILIDADLPDFPLKDFVSEMRLANISTRSKNPVPMLLMAKNLETVHAQVGHLEGI